MDVNKKREILFRGKTKDGEWVYWNELGVINFDLTDTEISLYVHLLNDELMFETVGQYTGLTDKNGKKIFEGDIVAYNELYIDGKEYQEIGYFECDERYLSFRIHGTQMTPFYCEIIGNIHDNPELLKLEKWKNPKEKRK